MSEPREHEMKTNEGLTTEQLANAGDGRATGEPRSFRSEPQGRGDGAGALQPIFSEQEAAGLRRAWEQVQGGFVDEPRQAVEDADHLVASAIKRLAEMFAEERQRLESQWDHGDDVSTEELRVALQRYRAFFGRLLSV
jgi:hypothetical protein